MWAAKPQEAWPSMQTINGANLGQTKISPEHLRGISFTAKLVNNNNSLNGISAKISEISVPLWKSANKSILIYLENPPSKKSSNANANSLTKIVWIISIRHEIPQKEISG